MINILIVVLSLKKKALLIDLYESKTFVFDKCFVDQKNNDFQPA